MDYYYLAKRETETERGTDTDTHIHIHTQNELSIHTTCVVLKGTVLTEKSQSQNTVQGQNHNHRDHVNACQAGGSWGGGGEVTMKRLQEGDLCVNAVVILNLDCVGGYLTIHM